MIFFIQAAKFVPGRNRSNDAYARVCFLDQVFSVCSVAGHAPGGGVEGAAMREGFLLESRTALSVALLLTAGAQFRWEMHRFHGCCLSQRPDTPAAAGVRCQPASSSPGAWHPARLLRSGPGDWSGCIDGSDRSQRLQRLLDVSDLAAAAGPKVRGPAHTVPATVGLPWMRPSRAGRHTACWTGWGGTGNSPWLSAPSGPGSSDSPLPPCPDEGLAVAQESPWVSGTTWTAASSGNRRNTLVSDYRGASKIASRAMVDRFPACTSRK